MTAYSLATYAYPIYNGLMANNKKCSIEGCEKVVFAKGWCTTHFGRWRNHGNPLKLIIGKKNEFEIKGKIALVNAYNRYGEVSSHFVIDTESLWVLELGKWSVNGLGYVQRGPNAIIKLHRVLTDAPEGMFVDHINGDTLDNRLENLRICTHADNCHNSKPNYERPYKGVSEQPRGSSRFMCRIEVDGKKYNLGTLDTPEEAAHTYDNVAVQLYGQYARLNITDNNSPKKCHICGYGHTKDEGC